MVPRFGPSGVLNGAIAIIDEVHCTAHGSRKEGSNHRLQRSEMGGRVEPVDRSALKSLTDPSNTATDLV